MLFLGENYKKRVCLKHENNEIVELESSKEREKAWLCVSRSVLTSSNRSRPLGPFSFTLVHESNQFCSHSPDLYCSLEVDSFGYFVNKAKTRVYRDSTEPSWNEVRNFFMIIPQQN